MSEVPKQLFERMARLKRNPLEDRVIDVSVQGCQMNASITVIVCHRR
jgi:hypothetical protein